MKTHLSVVIPTYKRPELLLRCLDALTAQNFDHNLYEIMVVTDGPDLVTEKAVRAFQQKKTCRVHCLVMPKKKGPAAARNYGWLAARGELVAFTDDDCIPNDNWISAFYQEYLTDSTRAFTGKTIVPLPDKPTDHEHNTAGLETADFITANCACPKKLLSAIGGFDEQFAMAWREDSELEFKLIAAGIPVAKVNDAVVVHPVRQANWGVSLKEQKKTMYNALLYKKYPTLYRRKIQPLPPVYYYIVLMSFVLMLISLLTQMKFLFIGSSVSWFSLSMWFFYRRLKFTSRKPAHILEMAVTSLLIPFLSIYWQFYGAFKYRVLFI